jgi:hypothetical protein
MPEPASFDPQALLKRVEELEATLQEVTGQLTAALQLNECYRQQLHGSKSERYDPAQHHLDFDEATLGKPESSGPETSGPEEDDAKRKKVKRARRTKDQLFPRWIKSIIVEEIIPDEVKANPEAYREIESREHRELETTRGEIYWRVTRIPKFVLKTDKQQTPIASPAPISSVPGTPSADHNSSAKSSAINFAITFRIIAKANASHAVTASNSNAAPSTPGPASSPTTSAPSMKRSKPK